jgi:hypothetical protein
VSGLHNPENNHTNFGFSNEFYPGASILIYHAGFDGSIPHSILLRAFPAVGSGKNDIHAGTQGLPNLVAISIFRFYVRLHLLDHVTQIVHIDVIYSDILRQMVKLETLDRVEMARAKMQLPPG